MKIPDGPQKRHRMVCGLDLTNIPRDTNLLCLPGELDVESVLRPGDDDGNR